MLLIVEYCAVDPPQVFYFSIIVLFCSCFQVDAVLLSCSCGVVLPIIIIF
jgi:hypothetical protein